MGKTSEGVPRDVDRIQAEMFGRLREPMPGRRWAAPRRSKTWSPPTDVFETDTCIVVKVEIAGMREEDFDISLQAEKLTISGVRHDPAAKLAYQQMEILYGHFESYVHLPRAIDPEGIEATYERGFLQVRLPKAKPRQVPIANTS